MKKSPVLRTLEKVRQSVFELPEGVLLICRTLERHNERGYLVGGAVRDLLRGEPVCDFDIATTASPQVVMKLFSRTVPTGIDHGTVTVLLGRESFEVTSLRIETDYENGRHPDAVAFVDDITQDLARRDFTVNAMAYDPFTKKLYDPFDGRGDLARRRLKAVGRPSSRFAEDGLRVMRAARFAAVLGFDVEPETAAAVGENAAMIEAVSMERRRDELTRLLLAVTPAPGIEVLALGDVMRYVCVDLWRLFRRDPEALERTCSRVTASEPTLASRLYAFTAEIRQVRQWCASFLFSKSIRRRVLHFHHCVPMLFSLVDEPLALRRFAAVATRGELPSVIRAATAFSGQHGQDADRVERVVAAMDKYVYADLPLTVGELPVDGKQLMQALHRPAGPWLGEMLRRLLEAVWEAPHRNTERGLLEWAAIHVDSEMPVHDAK